MMHVFWNEKCKITFDVEYIPCWRTVISGAEVRNISTDYSKPNKLQVSLSDG